MSISAPGNKRDSNNTWLNQILHTIINPTPSAPSVPERSGSNRGRELTASQENQPPSSGNNATDTISLTTTACSYHHDAQPEVSTEPLPSPSLASFNFGGTSTNIDPETSRQSSVSRSSPDLLEKEEHRQSRSSTVISRASCNISSERSVVSSIDAADLVETSRTHLRAAELLQKDEISAVSTEALPLSASKGKPKHAKRLSAITVFSGFETHSIVPPSECRRASGEGGDPDHEEDPAEYPGPLPLALIVLGICLSCLIVSLDRNIIATAIPDITARFHSYDDIGWYGSAYLLMASAFQPLYGRIYTSFHIKSTFLIALSLFEVGSLVAAICPSSFILILGRAIQGLGSAGLITGAFVVGTHSVKLQHRPVLFAGVGILYGIGALCGPLLGGAFTDTIGWRWCFWINLPAGAVTGLTVFFCFDGKSNITSKQIQTPFFKRILQLDIIGNTIFLGAMTMLILALQFSQERFSWSTPLCIGLLSGFGTTTLIFMVWIYYRGDSALIPPRIVKQRAVASGCGAAFFIYGALLIHSYYLPIWFQAIKNASAIEAGVNMIPYMAMSAVFSLLAGIFVSRNGLFAFPSILGCAIGAIGSGLLATIKPSTPVALWVAFELVIAMGLGMAIQQGFTAVQATLPIEDVPIGTAAVVASQSLGGAIFVSVGNTLLQQHLLNVNNAKAIPGVNVRAVIELGATRFRDVIPADKLPALIELYNDSLQSVFIAAVPLCGVAFICSLCMQWKNMSQTEWNAGATSAPEDADTKV